MKGIAQLKKWGLRSVHRRRLKAKKDKYQILMLPRTPLMAPPIMTIAHMLASVPWYNQQGGVMPVEIQVARIINPNDKYLGFTSRKQYKQVYDSFTGPSSHLWCLFTRCSETSFYCKYGR